MRDYGKIFTTFWTSPTARAMSEDGRTVALYLMSSPHTNMIGVFRLPDGYICEDLQWPSERVSKGLANCSLNGFATREEGSKWLVIHKHLQWNPIENPNQAKAALKLIESIPQEMPEKPAVARVMADSCERFRDKLDKGFWNRLETLSKPVTGTGAVTGTVTGLKTPQPRCDLSTGYLGEKLGEENF